MQIKSHSKVKQYIILAYLSYYQIKSNKMQKTNNPPYTSQLIPHQFIITNLIALILFNKSAH